VRADIRAVEMRIVELEQFRREATHRMDGLDAMATKYVPMIEQLTAQEKITAAVGVALEQSEHRGWTKRERIIAIGLFVLTTIGVGVSLASFIILRLAE
jgi:glycyl-tRNA synthetase (class II)